MEKPVVAERVPEIVPIIPDSEPKTSDDPKPAPAPDKVEPVPPPWQSALNEVTAFLKRNLPSK